MNPELQVRLSCDNFLRGGSRSALAVATRSSNPSIMAGVLSLVLLLMEFGVIWGLKLESGTGVAPAPLLGCFKIVGCGKGGFLDFAQDGGGMDQAV
jgi:hypothetical protein